MPRKRVSTKPKRHARAPTSPSAPPKPLEGQSVPLDPFQADWDALPPRQKERARWLANDRGVTLRTLHRVFPKQFRGEP